MKLKRLIEIVEAYGSKPSAWPVEERDAATAFLKLNPEAEDYRVKQEYLDSALDKLETSNIDLNTLSSSILAKIDFDLTKTEIDQPSLTDRILGWVFPEKPILLWQPALAAALPMTIGIILGSQLAASDTDDEWDQEFYLNSFSSVSFHPSPNKLNELNSEELGND